MHTQKKCTDTHTHNGHEIALMSLPTGNRTKCREELGGKGAGRKTEIGGSG